MLASTPKTKVKPANGHIGNGNRITPLMRTITYKAGDVPRPGRDLKIHPHAMLLPEMSPSDFAALESDILRLGRIRDVIVLLDGDILDGRHRYKIARKHGIPFETRDFNRQTEGDPVAFVYSRAVGRNMDQSQKVAAAVGFLEHFEEEARIRQAAAGGDKRASAAPGAIARGRARDQVGELFGVTGRYIQKAKSLKERSSDLFDDVFAGRKLLNVADREYVKQVKKSTLTQKAADARMLSRTRKLLPWEIITGDAVVELKAAKFIAGLAATDPKYNLGFDYGQGPQADQMPESDYLKWCRTWMELLSDRLANDGSMFVMIDARHQARFAIMLGEVGLFWRNTIIWHETFGNYSADNFTPCARYIHYFVKNPKRFVWHGDEILIPSDRQTKYNDPRASAGGKVPGNVWEIPRLVGNAREVMPGFANQLPLTLADRIVTVASDPGDLVVDPFTGTGTFGESAIRLGRRFVGTEIVDNNANWARARLTAAYADVASHSEKK
jgi:DNA modification methylase